MSSPTTPPAPAVHSAINQVKAAIGKEGITKDRRNADQNYRFRGIDDIYNALNPLMADAGLNILPRILKRECTERKTAAGRPMFSVVVEAEFDFVAAKDGSTYTARTFGEAMDTADKATNKAMSAAYKYVCMQAFAIPTEGDNDADAHTPEVAPQDAAGKTAPAGNARSNASRGTADKAPANRGAARSTPKADPKPAGPFRAPADLPPRQRLAAYVVEESTHAVVQKLFTSWKVSKVDELSDEECTTAVGWVEGELAKGGN